MCDSVNTVPCVVYWGTTPGMRCEGTQTCVCRSWAHPPAEVVEHHDVGIHVVQVVAVGRVLLTGPDVWVGALV